MDSCKAFNQTKKSVVKTDNYTIFQKILKVLWRDFVQFSSKLAYIKSDLTRWQKLLDVFFNCPDVRIWGSENPHVIVGKQIHTKRVTVWGEVWFGLALSA